MYFMYMYVCVHIHNYISIFIYIYLTNLIFHVWLDFASPAPRAAARGI